MFDTSSDQEDQPAKSRARSSSPASHRSITPTPATREKGTSRRSITTSPSSDASVPPKSVVKGKKNRLDAFMANLDGSDGEADHTPRAKSRIGSSPNKDIADFFATLQQQSDEEDDQARPSQDKTLPKTSSDPVGLFDDEYEERDKAIREGKSKIKVSHSRSA
jgi:hypothetical protein